MPPAEPIAVEPGPAADPAPMPEPAPERVPASAPAPASALPAAARAMLDEHNRARAQHCAPALTWSPKVAAAAQRWANHLRDQGCAFEHSQTEYGENLAAGSTGSMSPRQAVAMWMEEKRDYDFGRGGFSMKTGHFTQVIWRGSSQLGCGMSSCDGMDIWVCNYAPPGNMEGEYKQNVLPESCR